MEEASPMLFRLEELKYIVRKVYRGKPRDAIVDMAEMRKLCSEVSAMETKAAGGRKGKSRGGRPKKTIGMGQKGSQGK